MANRVITTSANLEAVPPENTGVDNHTIITSPAQYANWAALFALYPPTPGFQYRFRRGDYRPWGPFAFTNSHGKGVAGNRVQIRYDDTGKELHPVARKAAANEAVFDALRWNGTTQRSWMTHGLTFRGTTNDLDIISAIGDIVHDFVLIEDQDRNYGYRNRSGDGNVLQRFVIRTSLNYGTGAGDIGVNIVPQSAPVTGWKVLDGEIYDWGDSFQVSDNAGDMYMACSGLVEGLDLYVTAARQAACENAMDFKAGSDTVQTIVRNCRMWGFRQGAESTGELITIHNGARNILWEDCVYGDAPFGLHVVAWDAGNLPPGGLGMQTPRNLITRRGWFHDIRDYGGSGDGRGAAWRTINNERYEDGAVARCDALEYIHNNVVHAGGPTYANMLRVLPTLKHHVASAKQVYSDVGNRIANTPSGYYTYQRKRWTGIETVAGAEPLSKDGMGTEYSTGPDDGSSGDGMGTAYAV